MPAVTSGKVLITGANGYISTWTVKAFLDAGFSVRGTVREERKAEHLRKVFSTYGDRFEIALIPDMTLDDAFDAAAAGTSAIIHTASPVNLLAVEPAEAIVPAERGTVSALRAAARTPSVRRVVLLSSFATVIDPRAPVSGPDARARVYDGACWNEGDPAEVARLGRASTGVNKYRASKVAAERAAWAAYGEAKAAGGGSCAWDLAVVNPPWVFGPVMHEVRGGPETMNESNKYWHRTVFEGKPVGVPHSWIDARDLATALLLTTTIPAAGGQRFLVAEGPFRWEDFRLLVAKESSKAPPLEDPYDPSAEYLIRADTRPAQEILGMVKYRSKEEMVKDMLADYALRGWL
ncbi:NAD-P-binding protein [Epithele typhae]|uniref:NAD-P-binding protein n=1 Tax=Epithele typhae TaxID=378194 RepID=UPI002008795B|nr:NAD-P-binding protein [Epithele typhae]KAH9918741.1 NAD-P-binding protein [Epithele typhae]